MEEVGRPTLRTLFGHARSGATGFFCELFVDQLEAVGHKHCPAGWPKDAKARTLARRAASSFLKSQTLGDDPDWDAMVMEYLRGMRSTAP